ncbi:helix-turn-helix transcriptional regulator [Actinomyces sp.]|uniref:helix-turn-helix domain-containing protein n=1 Tax=Actinomyces sp. TaxID=29317 RepID=UPI0029075553|nr:helix-turn-helix transcriptional regulator [Actinomyces sp.]MDU6757701.1 helix-turn-helix transcriptional regulator [Actinomyces sp.]
MDKLFKLFGIDSDNPLDMASARMAADRYAVPELLKQVRIKNNISQAEAARRMRTDQGTISRIEAGERDLHMSTLRRYADAVHAEIIIDVTNTEQVNKSEAPAEDVWEEDTSQYKLRVQGV